MIQDLTKNDTFEPEIQEYLTLKSKASRHVYSSALKHFLDFYRNKYGKDKTISHFLDRIFDEFKKERRKQKRIAELELVEYINYLKMNNKSNNSIRSYFGGIQNFLKSVAPFNSISIPLYRIRSGPLFFTFLTACLVFANAATISTLNQPSIPAIGNLSGSLLTNELRLRLICSRMYG